MAALVLIGLPVVLLCLGVPIFVALIAAASIRICACCQATDTAPT